MQAGMESIRYSVNLHLLTLFPTDASSCLATWCKPVLTWSTSEHSWLTWHCHWNTGNVTAATLVGHGSGWLSQTFIYSGGITASRRGQKDLNSGHSWRRPCPLDMLHDDGNDDQHLTVSPIRYNRWSNFGTDLGHSYRIISIEHCHCLWCFGSNEWSWTSHMIK